MHRGCTLGRPSWPARGLVGSIFHQLPMKEDVDDAGYFFWHIWTVASFDVNTGRYTVLQGGASRGGGSGERQGGGARTRMSQHDNVAQRARCELSRDARHSHILVRASASQCLRESIFGFHRDITG